MIFRVTSIIIISAVLLLAAGSLASARESGYMDGGYGHRLDVATHPGSLQGGDTATAGRAATGSTMPGSSGTMADHFALAAGQMRAHAAQVEAASHMQQPAGMGPAYGTPGYGMQTGDSGTGTGYMDPADMGPGTGGTGYMDPGTMGPAGDAGTYSPGTMGGGTGTGPHPGTMGSGAPQTGSSPAAGAMRR
ncbi:MAG: hypothetical protein HZB44_03215 [Actinobacteria bacterium]|nr:hypothetical protein [Actinomycetota bacterium]